MFAVIRTGGKQYRVAKDDKIVVEKLPGEPGAVVELSDVLMIGGGGKAPTVGTPVIDKAAVFAEVVEQSRADKIIVFKKKRRKGYRRTRGHRQQQTVLRIVDVSLTGAKPKPEVKPEAKKETKAAPKETAKKEAPKKEAAKKETKAPAKKKAAPRKKAAKAPAVKAKAAAPKETKKKPAAKKKVPTQGTTKGKSKE